MIFPAFCFLRTINEKTLHDSVLSQFLKLSNLLITQCRILNAISHGFEDRSSLDSVFRRRRRRKRRRRTEKEKKKEKKKIGIRGMDYRRFCFFFSLICDLRKTERLGNFCNDDDFCTYVIVT